MPRLRRWSVTTAESNARNPQRRDGRYKFNGKSKSKSKSKGAGETPALLSAGLGAGEGIAEKQSALRRVVLLEFDFALRLG
jgi:hypothetical protein